MRKIKIILILVLCTNQLISGIEPTDRRIVTGGFGIGLGIFYPKEINDYIKNLTEQLLITSGIADMFVNFIGKASISVTPARVIEISGFCEFNWAPKYILVSSGDDYYFSFTKISPGLSPKIHIPFASGRHSIFFAPAVTYNFLKFIDNQYLNDQSITNKCWGAKMQMGFNLDLKKIIIKPYVGYDHVKSMRDHSVLNYSGAQIGVDFHF